MVGTGAVLKGRGCVAVVITFLTVPKPQVVAVWSAHVGVCGRRGVHSTSLPLYVVDWT